jgi:phosphate transport system substrate-binding protein
MKFDERAKCQEAGKSIVEKFIAYDACAIIVNPSNGVSKLTHARLEGLYIDRTKNWNQVGGAGLKIISYSRETSSGTYDFIKEYMLLNKNFSDSILSLPATGAIAQSVSRTKAAIGYVGLAYLNNSVKALHVFLMIKIILSQVKQLLKTKHILLSVPCFSTMKNQRKKDICLLLTLYFLPKVRQLLNKQVMFR